MDIRDFWAKTEPFQSVVTHGIVSGITAQHLFSQVIAVGTRKTLTERLSLPFEHAVCFLGYYAALHDIGKIDYLFQAKDEVFREKMKKENNLLAMGIPAHVRHEKTSADALKTIWGEQGRDRRTYKLLADIIQKHHQGKSGDGGCRNEEWTRFRKEYEEHMREFFNPQDYFPLLKQDTSGPASVLLLAIIILADWIASGEYFSDAETWGEDIGIKTAEQANMFLQRTALLPDKGVWGSRFSDLWPNIPGEGMRPLQKETEALFTEERAERLSALLVEAPMGEGKTEAGIYAAVKLAEQWGKDGFYIALPTAATSNQMVKRVRDLFKMHGTEAQARLLHSMAWLVDEQTESDDISSEDEKDSLRNWLQPVRRGLLGQYAVGTVDQAMLAGTIVKYGVLRLLGLSDKTLLIDEVHSYDVYMDEILVRLLEWCKALEIPVVLLSATLPPDLKNKLLIPFGGEGKDAYPALTAVTEEGNTLVRPVRETTRRQTVSVEFLPILYQNEKIAAQAIDLVSQGGCLCVLLNTVRQAQAVYQEIKKNTFDGDLMLFHAQFPAGQRDQIEKICIRKYGKDKSHRPRKSILVATQVVEQSLDVDFDSMMTANAPVDLVIQRMGRIFRHDDTKRPFGMTAPKQFVMVPGNGEYAGDKAVYPECLLKQSEHILSAQKQVRIPEDLSELVKKGYDIHFSQETLQQAWTEMLIEDSVKAGSSTKYLLSPPDKRLNVLQDDTPFDDSDTGGFLSVKTRLGEPCVRIALLEPDLYKKIVPLLETRLERKYAPVTDKKLAQEILKQSVSVRKKQISRFQSGLLDIKGDKIITNIIMFPSENGKVFFDGGGSIQFDSELGVKIEEGEKNYVF